jgi:hypothetical protein
VKLHEASSPLGDTQLERTVGPGKNSLSEVPKLLASTSQKAPYGDDKIKGGSIGFPPLKSCNKDGESGS